MKHRQTFLKPEKTTNFRSGGKTRSKVNKYLSGEKIGVSGRDKDYYDPTVTEPEAEIEIHEEFWDIPSEHSDNFPFGVYIIIMFIISIIAWIIIAGAMIINNV